MSDLSRDGSGPSTAPEAGQERVPLVLVVEDSEDVGSILAEALEDEGCATRVARNGREALALASQLHPDLITLDLGLPGKSGWDVLADLRAADDTRDIPIVAVSAHAHELEPAFEVQLARVIPKPFYLSDDVDAVLETLAGGEVNLEAEG